MQCSSAISFEKAFCPELVEKELFTPPIRSCHTRYSIRPQYTLSHRIVAQIKSKSSNTFCSKALTRRNSTRTNASCPLTNGAPPYRQSRRGIILIQHPRTQILWFVPISPLLFDWLFPQNLGIEILVGLGYFLDIILFILVQVLLIYMDFPASLMKKRQLRSQFEGYQRSLV